MTINYSDLQPALHRGNPLIEALPPITADRATLTKELQLGPRMSMEACRADPLHLRVHNVHTLDSVYLPTPVSLRIADATDEALRAAYVPRNPMTRDGEHYRYQDFDPSWSPISSVASLGCLYAEAESGLGKTTMFNRILARYPQVIIHQAYRGVPFHQTQLVWIRVQTPRGGATIQLLWDLLGAIDQALAAHGIQSSFRPSQKKGDLMDRLSRAARTLFLGLIHIDDVQQFCASTRGEDEVRGFLVRLTEVVKVPLLLTGTLEATKFFGGGFEVARRACSLGAFEITRAKSASDSIFDALARHLLSFQLVDRPLEVTSELVQELYDMSKGVTAVLKKLHIDAQKIAMKAPHVKAGSVSLTLAHYKAAAASLKVLAAQLRDLNPKLSEVEAFAQAASSELHQ
ncbi:ATP-binding protein [Roseateles sp. So40a]|uniref:ATP-binding protein n=1 Tax=Roseateles sp. So40a TaxID=3400226 RepID=UPI003A8B2D00